MAQVSLNDKLRPALLILAKYHFWMLAAIVPLIIVPALFSARGHFDKQINAVREQIKACIGSLQSVRKITQHPNPAWSADIDTSTMRVKRETLAEWVRFWDSQAAFRTWPDSLGDDFVKAVTTLKPDGKLPRKLLERYQNNVRSLVRELPGRMAVEDQMVGLAGMAGANPGGDVRPRGPGVGEPAPAGFPGAFQPAAQQQGSPYVATWSGDNQRQLYASFDWETAPSTTQVLMAQEELRMYGLLCDVIAGMNKSATGPHNAAISQVNQLYVGYLAAEDVVGGSTAGRLRGAGPAAGGGPMSQPDPGAAAEGGGGGKPAHPRFGGGSSGPGGQMTGSSPEGGPPAAPVFSDDSYRNWVYVDFNDHPLDAGGLAAAPDAKMVHLMPFVMKLVMDQRQLDALLVELATAPLPIDVRQVRINVGGAAGPGMPGGPMMPGGEGIGGGPAGATPAGARIYDLPIEIHGTIGLATQPSEQAVGLEPGQGLEQPAGDGGEKPAAQPKTSQVTAEKRRVPA